MASNKIVKNCNICNEKLLMYLWQDVCLDCSKKKREVNDKILSI